MNREPFLTQYNSLLRDIINSIAAPIEGDFLTKALKRFKFENIDGWAFLTASLDLIQDTEDAKQNFHEFGLSGPTRYDNLGEKYLRLYGILNAVYLQVNAITNFGELFKIDSKRKHDKHMRELRIVQLRHIAGSHTVNYLSPTSQKIEAYMIAQHSLDTDEIQVMNGDNIFESYHLSDLLTEYDTEACAYFEIVIEKALSLFDSKSKALKEFQNRFGEIKAERRGDIIIMRPAPGSGAPPIHIRIVRPKDTDVKKKTTKARAERSKNNNAKKKTTKARVGRPKNNDTGEPPLNE